ncbi:MAG TPA: metal-dependent hydrolase [Blastocatellia bacterium]|nr:metal-dependent hydrolase [Blastocatellia bacterium]
MSPITHFLAGWLVANTSQSLDRRERAIITVAGVAPDVDGLGLIADALTANSKHPTDWFSRFHHLLGHNLAFGLLIAVLAFLVVKRRWITAGFVLVSFHLHLLFDLLGSRGPDGYQWPIQYLFPFSSSWQWTWAGQWALNAWPNFIITGAALATVFVLAWKRGYSPLEMVSVSADKAFVTALRRRFPVSA